jgi:hypothetical protein
MDDFDYYFKNLFVRACGRYLMLPKRLDGQGGAKWIYLELIDAIPGVWVIPTGGPAKHHYFPASMGGMF